MKSNFELVQIEKFRKIRQNRGVVLGPGDDAAVLSSVDPAKEQLVFCGDMLIEDVHFDLKQASLREVGYKAVGRTLSDIAAMGAEPLYMGFSLALPKRHRRYIDNILRGAQELLDVFNCSLVGGDMSSADKIFCDTWCVGKVKKNKFKTRSGIKTNDAVFVSGALGGSYKTKRHLKFMPRIREASLLVDNFPINAMIDVSDGLVFDLYRMLKDSSKSVMLLADQIPCHDGITKNGALYDGEDYELLFTANKRYLNKIVAAGFYHIGNVCPGKNKVLLRNSNKSTEELKPKGFSSLS